MNDTQIAKIQLKDGNRILDSWSQDFERLPVPGEQLDIDLSRNEFLDRYQPEAMVSKVEINPIDQSHTVILQARIKRPIDGRTVIRLNRDRTPKFLPSLFPISLSS